MNCKAKDQARAALRYRISACAVAANLPEVLLIYAARLESGTAPVAHTVRHSGTTLRVP